MELTQEDVRKLSNVLGGMRNRPYSHEKACVCEEWKGKNGLQNFLKWCSENGYHQGLQIDRIDNRKGYYPENCRFVTRSVNQRNKSTNAYLLVNGEMKTIADIANENNISYSLLYGRLNRGWTLEDAISVPKGNLGSRNLAEHLGWGNWAVKRYNYDEYMDFQNNKFYI